MLPDYDVAQICLNGHVINTLAGSHPESNKKFCSNCGSMTIMRCLECAHNY